MTYSTGFVDLARSDTGEANTRPLCAPDRPIAIPYAHWGASERCAGRDDLSEE